MWQVWFRLPIYTSMTPDGVAVGGFGVMLFVVFLVTVWFAGRRAKEERVATPDNVQDMAVWLFAAGILGARAVNMYETGRPWSEFFRIWEGGITFYGSFVGGWVGYAFAYYFVLRKFNISTWKLADIVAPTLAIGVCLGRVGCYLNGCCYGPVANPDEYGARYPLLCAPCREDLVDKFHYQTAAGFTGRPADGADPRTVVERVEPGSEAEAAGVRPGDLVTAVNGKPNDVIARLIGPPEAVAKAKAALAEFGGRPEGFDQGNEKLVTARVAFPPAEFAARVGPIEAAAYRAGVDLSPADRFTGVVASRARGLTDLSLTVSRDGKDVGLPTFTPRSLPLLPTQLYESASMVLLFFVMVAFYPFRRHDGQVLTLFMFGYGVHRFFNEMVRYDNDPMRNGLTLSQNISLAVIAAAVILEVWLWRDPSRRVRRRAGGEPAAAGGEKAQAGAEAVEKSVAQ